MNKLSLSCSWSVLCVALAACGGRVDTESSDGGGGGSTTSSSDTTSSSSGSTTTDTWSTTETFCECVTDADCPAGDVCQGCVCLPEPLCDGQPCLCEVGEIQSCYSGPPGTDGVGVCHAGVQTCVDGLSWGPCEGESLPQPETCGDLDENCDGLVGSVDVDGDGWSVCDGDCCEDAGCSDHPELVNPGAMEVVGNGLDDDCNATTPDDAPAPPCASMPWFDSVSAAKLIQAMDLCVFTWEDPPPSQKTWGVIATSLTLADAPLGSSPPTDEQVAVLGQYGPNVLPQAGPTMAALSTGTARAEGDPGHFPPQQGPLPDMFGGFIANTAAPIPADFLSANNGVVPTPCGGCAAPECATAYDSVQLHVRLRAPTNMDVFSFDIDFYTAEMPENVCTARNDFFVALLDGPPIPDIPLDKNVAFDSMFNPISVNNTWFLVSDQGPLGTAELVGTGMGGWNGALDDGAASGWLHESLPVVPGSTFELRFVIWDAIDGDRDSLVLLDNARFEHSEPPPWDH